MYVEEKSPTLLSSDNTEAVYIFCRVHRSFDKFGAARKLAGLLSVGPPNDQGSETGTILNKSIFLLGT